MQQDIISRLNILIKLNKFKMVKFSTIGSIL